MTDTNQLPEPELGYIQTDKSNQPAFSARQMREAMKHALQARAQVQGEPFGFTYQAEIAYADSTGGNGSFWRVPPDLDDEAVPLYTHPAPNVPADVVLTIHELREIQRAVDDFSDCGETDVPDRILMRGVMAGYLECTNYMVVDRDGLRDAIDAAMLAAKDTK